MFPVQTVTALTIGGSVTFGIVLALLGHLKLAVSRRPEQATGRVDLLLTLLNLALIPMMVAAGLLVDCWGTKPTIMLGSVLLSLSFLALSASPGFRRSLCAVIVAGFGAAAVGTASLILMPAGLFGDHEKTASLHLGLVLVALCALLTPPLVDLLVRGIGFRRTMAVVAFLALAPAFLAALSANVDLPARGSISGLAPLVNDLGVWLAGVVFFFYAPLEAFISVWTTAWLASIGQQQKQMRWLAGFWSAFLLSRLAFAFIEHAGYLHDDWSKWFLFGSAILTAVVIGNLLGAFRSHHAGIGLVILGCFLGPVLPFLAGLLFRVDSARDLPLPGTAFALLYGCGSVGSLALAPLVGLSANARTIQAALRIPLIIALLLSAATLLFILVQSGSWLG
jgi:hypothetical protein